MRTNTILTLRAVATAGLASGAVAMVAMADIRITEWMYSGADGEFFEITNLGTEPVDLTGWSYDDSNRVPGAFSIGAIGILQPCESAIITEAAAAAFRAAWNLDASARIVGDLGKPNANNLGRNDSIYLYNAQGAVVDVLVYGDQDFPGSIRTQNVSGWTLGAGLGQNDPYQWILSFAGDAQGSITATSGDLGNPGSFVVLGPTQPGLTMVISEYMYAGQGGEFIEFTNVSGAPIDLTGWSFDDSNAGSGAILPFDLGAFGVVQPGESVVIAEAPAETFRTVWSLPASVKVIGNLGAGNGNNLGRNDEINIYDHDGALVDRLTYGDQDFPGSIRTLGASGWTDLDGVGINDPYAWTLALSGDVQQSYISAGGDTGNPGIYVPASCDRPGDPADLNGDGIVDGADLGILLGNWGGAGLGDLDGNGIIDGADLGLLLGSWS
ncbi:MAG TPA: lamin tail domain-containing protein [Phycisphaerales bacterium]|nr:lamin tail domain-containing protein [Phycisphaerales bacterium]HMP36901.1 lamin tail domain-containing protein [Phycisphaerales bacterium]